MTRPAISRRELLRFGSLSLGGLRLRIAAAQASSVTGGNGGIASSCSSTAARRSWIRSISSPRRLSKFVDRIDRSTRRYPASKSRRSCRGSPRLAHRFAILRSATHPFNAHNSSAAYAPVAIRPGATPTFARRRWIIPPMDRSWRGCCRRWRGMPPFVLTPTFLFDMGFPTPSAGGGWMGNRDDPLPAVRNRMMARSPAWEGKAADSGWPGVAR